MFLFDWHSFWKYVIFFFFTKNPLKFFTGYSKEEKKMMQVVHVYKIVFDSIMRKCSVARITEQYKKIAYTKYTYTWRATKIHRICIHRRRAVNAAGPAYLYTCLYIARVYQWFPTRLEPRAVFAKFQPPLIDPAICLLIYCIAYTRNS